MTTVLVEGTVITSAMASGISSGIAFAFSNFIMRAFSRLREPEAIRAMQAINETVINPLFLAVFIGTGLLMAGLSSAHLFIHRHWNAWLWGGTIVYLAGVVLVTMFANVPLNDALATTNADAAPEGAWQRYASPWTRWNHVRTLSAAAASVAFILGMQA